jgi:oxygen-independent coproporphyrinogen-3 oxidase
VNANTATSFDPRAYEPSLGVLLERHPELQIDQDDYNINVTANYGENLTAAQVFDRYRQHPGADRSAHLYFHFPLCSYICHFCNYVKALLSPGADREKTLARWTTALIKESQQYLDRVPWLSKARIESFYIGGGTAAILERENLRQILDHVRANYAVSSDCELSLEGNPDNFCDKDKLQAAIELGFNRFSVGVQSFQEEVTKYTNRGHTPQMSLQAVKDLKASGFPFNVDMMFGLPHQTPDTVGEDLRILVDLGVPTITIYRFRNADRAKMGIGNNAAWNLPKVRDRLRQAGMFPSLNGTYAMRERAVRYLLDYGYEPSPCGWWSLRGTYPDGNIPRVSRNKWQRFDSMIAFGPGSYGWLTGANREALQTHNLADVSGYLQHMESSSEPPLAFGRLLTGLQAVGTALGFAYKANQPIYLDRFKEEYGVDLLGEEPYMTVFQELLQKGLMHLVEDGAAIRPTLDGEALHEEIISVYLHKRVGSFCAEVCHKV